MDAHEPRFPPLITGHAVVTGDDVFAGAVAGARAGKLEAGDLLWSLAPDVLDVAVVLEPDVPRAATAQAAFVAQVAFSECFGALSPPEVALTFGWPMTLNLNGARVGGLRMAVADNDDDIGAPHWIVLGLKATLQDEGASPDPGLNPDKTSFVEEGCGDIAATQLVESFAHHLLTWFHTWEEDGFRPVHEAYVFRADHYRKEASFTHGGSQVSGTFIGLDDNGAALLKQADGTVTSLDAMTAAEREADLLPEPAS